MFTKHKTGFTLVELMIVLAIIAIIAAFAIPNLMKSRMSANETAAIGSLRAILSAEGTYMNRYNVYGSLAQLYADGLIDSSLSNGKKSGYYFGQVDDHTSKYSYCFATVPIEDGKSGAKEYTVTQQGTIYESAFDSSGFGTDLTSTPTTTWNGHSKLPSEFTTTPETNTSTWTPINQ